MAKLVVVAGLPGSGKSHYIEDCRPQFTGICVHDFMANSHGHSQRFTESRHYAALVRALREGKDCLIADVVYCDTWRRVEVEAVISRDVPGLEIEGRFFENDPAKCQANVERRARPNTEDEKRDIHQLSRKYHIPPGAVVIPVWDPAQ